MEPSISRSRALHRARRAPPRTRPAGSTGSGRARGAKSISSRRSWSRAFSNRSGDGRQCLAISARLPRVPVEVKPVASRRDLTRFIKLPMRLYRNEPNWIPPLVAERRAFLDRRKNPFFSHAEAEFFLAWRDGRAGGPHQRPRRPPLQRVPGQRLGAVRVLRVRERPGDRRARCSTRPQDWLRDRGRDRMVGPMDFTTNDECGLLVEGHERKPLILEGWHHPYYLELLEGVGPGEGDGPLHVGAAPRQGRGQGRLPPADPRHGEEGHRASTA